MIQVCQTKLISPMWCFSHRTGPDQFDPQEGSKMAEPRIAPRHWRTIDLTGKMFGHVTVIGEAPRNPARPFRVLWECACECGNRISIGSRDLRDKTGPDYRCPKCRAEYNSLAGFTFERLTVLEPAGVDVVGRMQWRCKCACGGECIASGTALRGGKKSSCGCLARERMALLNRQHGMSDTAIYKTWGRIHERCYKTSHHNYKHYGARGITVCERWHTFENFFSDMGHRPKGLTIERKDVNLGYSPDNCVWATVAEQNRNKRNTRALDHDGLRLTMSEWSKFYGKERHFFYKMIDNKGMTAEQVFQMLEDEKRVH